MKFNAGIWELCIVAMLLCVVCVITSCDNDEREFTPQSSVEGNWVLENSTDKDSVCISFAHEGVVRLYEFKNDVLIEFCKGKWVVSGEEYLAVLNNRNVSCKRVGNKLEVRSLYEDGKTLGFKKNDSTECEEEGSSDLVDLGLSVRWAAMNYGATSAEGRGTYYTYDNLPRDKFIDGWRLPTKAELQELCLDCTWQWDVLGGISGYVVTGRSGKSIFMPASGWINDEDAIRNIGSYGFYWSDTVIDNNANDNYLIYRLGFNESGSFDMNWVYKYTKEEKRKGYSYVVRLVHK